jgi:hypothetical protein
LRGKVVCGSIGTILKFFSFAFLVPAIIAVYFWELESSFLFARIPYTALVFLFCFSVTFTTGFLL